MLEPVSDSLRYVLRENVRAIFFRHPAPGGLAPGILLDRRPSGSGSHPGGAHGYLTLIPSSAILSVSVRTESLTNSNHRQKTQS